MRTQHVDYAVWERKLSSTGGLPGTVGYTDKARFIFHIGTTAFLFGKHEGKTLVVEFFTMGFLLRFRLMQTVETKPDRKLYGYHKGEPINAPSGWRILTEGEEIPQEHREYVAQDCGLWCEWRRCHSTMTPPKAKLWGDVRAYAARIKEKQQCC